MKEKKRVYRLDGDIVEVVYKYDPEFDVYLGEFIDFTEHPRHTPNGRPWMNATHIDCPYAANDYNDCGSCIYFLKESQNDLIGICVNDKKRRINFEEDKLQ